MRVLVFEHFTATGGRPSAIRGEGQAMRDAVADDFAAIAGVSVMTMDACDQTGEAGNAQRLRKKAVDADLVCVIAPETRGLLGSYVAIARMSCARVLNATDDVIQWASNKNLTANKLQQLGIPHPQTAALFGIEPFPVVAKPIDGAGSEGIVRIKTPEDWRRVARQSAHRWRVERLIPGLPASVGIVCAEAPTLMQPMRQLLTANLSHVGSEPIESRELTERAHALVSPLLPELERSFGWIGVDLVLGPAEDGSEDAVIEVNPRFTSSYLHVRSGRRHSLVHQMMRAVSQPAHDSVSASGR